MFTECSLNVHRRFHSLLVEVEDECWVYEKTEWKDRKKAKTLVS
jgi:hypothetical protein